MKDAYHTGYQLGRFLYDTDQDLDFKDLDLAVNDYVDKMEIDFTSSTNENNFSAGVVNGYIQGHEFYPDED